MPWLATGLCSGRFEGTYLFVMLPHGIQGLPTKELQTGLGYACNPRLPEHHIHLSSSPRQKFCTTATPERTTHPLLQVACREGRQAHNKRQYLADGSQSQLGALGTIWGSPPTHSVSDTPHGPGASKHSPLPGTPGYQPLAITSLFHAMKAMDLPPTPFALVTLSANV